MLDQFSSSFEVWEIWIDDDDDDDDGLYFKTMSIKAAKACGVVYNSTVYNK